MRTRFTVGLCLLFAASAALAATTGNLSPAQVFAQASPSIVVVEALDQDGKALYQGSGVVIHKGVVVSNCHVFTHDHVNTAIVRYQKKTYPASLRYADVAHDLCSFNVKGLPAPPIRLGSTAGLKVGEHAYAIGAPEGLDLSLSGGLISSLRHISDGTVIQMTTPISPGSSGGGLFDSHARLIGITSYYMKEGEQLNFAIPVEWVKSLPQRGETPKELTSRQSGQNAQNETSSSDFQKGVKAYLNGDYANAVHWYRKAAEQGYVAAQFNLGLMYDRGDGVSRNYAKAAYWFRKAAAQGAPNAQANLGWMYANGEGVMQNCAKAVHWYGAAAVQGNVIAQTNLGRLYSIGECVPKDYSSSAYWRRKAAEQGAAVAQAGLGVAYLIGRGVPQNYIQAVKWLILAQAAGDKKVSEVLPSVESKMTPEQIAEAQRLASEWWAKHHKQ